MRNPKFLLAAIFSFFTIRSASFSKRSIANAPRKTSLRSNGTMLSSKPRASTLSAWRI